MDNELLKQVTEKAEKWLSPEYDEETRAAVKAMLDSEDKTELIESFYKDLEFGTGGLRGIMGAGSNRMNIYTVGAATQGLSNYLKVAFKDLPEIKVVVGHDVRNNSRKFAEIVADIFSAHQGVSLRLLPPYSGNVVCNPPFRMPERCDHHCISQPERIQRLQSLLGRRRADDRPSRREHYQIRQRGDRRCRHQIQRRPVED